MKTIEIPELALVALIGASGSGKSTVARRHFVPTEVLSSDFFRGLVSDDENDQTCTREAFDALYYMLDIRLARGKLTVVDATNVRPEDRKRLVEHARKYHCFAVAIVMNTSERICQERNSHRPEPRLRTARSAPPDRRFETQPQRTGARGVSTRSHPGRIGRN